MAERKRTTGTGKAKAKPAAAEAEAPAEPKGEIVVALPGEGAVDKELIDSAVKRINQLYTGGALEMAREIGGYVLETFFAGKSENFRNRGGEHKTFSALAEHEDLQFSRVWLWRAVSVHDQLSQLPKKIADALPYTHHTLLLPVHNVPKKVELAEAAVKESWTKDVLQAEVAKVRKGEKKSKGGRKPLLAFVKTVNRFEKFLAAGDEAFGGLDELDQLDDDDMRKLHKTVTRMQRKLAEIAQSLQPVPDAE